MIKFVALACFVVCAQASLVAHAPLSTGTSTSSRTQDSAGNYAFAYNEQHGTGGSSRQESGNGWGAQGSYSLNVGDGRQRIVKYIADGAGFRAAISTNEPGTAAAPAASTAIASPYAPPAPVEPLPVPVVAAPAPVAVAAPLLTNGWGSQLAAPALPALAPAPVAVAAPLLTNGWGNAAPALAAPAPIAYAAPIAPIIKAVPAVSSYSTSINHVAPQQAIAVAAPLAAPLAIPAPAPIVQAPLLSGWN